MENRGTRKWPTTHPLVMVHWYYNVEPASAPDRRLDGKNWKKKRKEEEKKEITRYGPIRMR